MLYSWHFKLCTLGIVHKGSRLQLITGVCCYKNSMAISNKGAAILLHFFNIQKTIQIFYYVDFKYEKKEIYAIKKWSLTTNGAYQLL